MKELFKNVWNRSLKRDEKQDENHILNDFERPPRTLFQLSAVAGARKRALLISAENQSGKLGVLAGKN